MSFKRASRLAKGGQARIQREKTQPAKSSIDSGRGVAVADDDPVSVWIGGRLRMNVGVRIENEVEIDG